MQPRAGDPTTSPSSPLTAEQQQAVHCRDSSVVLSSGAGCGKTHVLTERYLSHLRDDDADIGELVAITFTDRAARQMRDRIRKALTAALHAAGEAAEPWEKHLRGLETAQITTIHAFSAALLRQNAVDAGLDPHFEVYEEVLAANLEAEALTACLQALLPAVSELGEDLRELVLLYGWPMTVDGVRALMQQQDDAWKTWGKQAPEQIAEQWQNRERQRLLPPYIAHLLAHAPKIAHCLALLRKLECVGPLMRVNVARILQETPALAKAADLAKAVKELTEAAKVGKERAKAWRNEEEYEAVKDAFDGFRKELPDRLALFMDDAANLPAAVVAGQRFLRVAEAAASAYRLKKRRNGVLDFQDLLTLARDLLRDNPTVREQLQRRYRFLLIDELQDTDPVQMELVNYLCGAELTTGKLFAVGDAKQSIYRWRGADVQQFVDLRDRVAHEGRLSLTRNFRSQPAILHFVNALFDRHIPDYQALEPHHPQRNPAACAEFLWTLRQDKESVNEGRAAEADAIARRIKQMVADREELVSDAGKLRPVQLKDVVLLFRAMSNVHLYENALRRHGIDYYLVGGRAFYAQQEIYDLLNLLRALENPQDAVSLAGTLRSPFCCLSDEALFLLACHADGLWAGLHDDAALARLPDDQQNVAERARRFLDRWCGLKDRLSIARLLGEVFADSGYDAAMQFEPLGDRKLANLWKLLDTARTFDRSGLFSLADFIQRLGDLVQSQPREEQAATQPENADVVRLMTIHQSKGLEFPVVIVPDLAARGGGGSNPVAVWSPRLGCVVRPPAAEDDEPPPFSKYGWGLWQAGEELADYHEDLRTLYVACTRAEDFLVLSASLPEPFQPNNAWMMTLAERFDLNTGTCRDEKIAAAKLPQVRVVERSSLASAGRLEAGATKLLDLPAVEARQLAPMPVRVSSRDVIPLEHFQSPKRKRGISVSLAYASGSETPLMIQFAAEDGSDRRAWLALRDRIDPQPPSPLRTALDAWDFRDPDGWRSAPADIAPLLADFAASATFRQVATARVCHRDLEFLLDPSDNAMSAFPKIAGMIDLLWQDEKHSWHLLAWATEAQPSLAEQWETRRPGLIVRAWAVQERFGVWPKSVGLYSFAEGQNVSCTSRQYRHRQVIAAVRTMLGGLVGNLTS